MSIPIVLHWLPNSTTGIAALQDVLAGKSFIFKSNIPGISIAPYIFAQDTIPQQVLREVTITSTNNYGTTHFVLTGIGSSVDGDGNPDQPIGLISEDLSGLNNNTLTSDNIYSQVISIVPSTNVSGVSIGWGGNGITDYVLLDYNRTIFQTAIQLQFIVHDAAKVIAYQTLSKPEYPSNSPTNSGNLTSFSPLPAFPVAGFDPAVTVNTLSTLISPVALTWATITDAVTDELYFTVLQQGLRS
jgi:hypothetical protein